MTQTEHPSPERLGAFVDGKCSAETATGIELHIDECEDCRVLLSTLVRSQRDRASDPTHQVAVTPVTPGELVAGKYKIERVIGVGGMGSVVAAWHQQLNQRVALKFILPAIAADSQAAARFLREARAAARLQTAHVGRVLDLDSLPNGTPYLVMEFLEGETLADRLRREKKLPAAAALGLIRQSLEALAEAHQLGIVHRDFKPANLFLTRRPDGTEFLKVLDFGIAKSVHPDIEQGLTSTSARMLMGSPPYMAPEQINFSSAIDARTDLWAVGVVLYELISGALPFEGANLVDVMFAVQNKAHRPLHEREPSVPSALSAAVDRCLSKRPERRFTTVAELSQALEGAESSPPAPVASRSTPRPAWLRRARWGAAIAGALAAAAVAWKVASSSAPTQVAPPAVAVPSQLSTPLPPARDARDDEVDDTGLAPLPAPATRAPPTRAPKKKPGRVDVFEERR